MVLVPGTDYQVPLRAIPYAIAWASRFWGGSPWTEARKLSLYDNDIYHWIQQQKDQSIWAGRNRIQALQTRAPNAKGSIYRWTRYFGTYGNWESASVEFYFANKLQLHVRSPGTTKFSAFPDSHRYPSWIFYEIYKWTKTKSTYGEDGVVHIAAVSTAADAALRRLGKALDDYRKKLGMVREVALLEECVAENRRNDLHIVKLNDIIGSYQTRLKRAQKALQKYEDADDPCIAAKAQLKSVTADRDRLQAQLIVSETAKSALQTELTQCTADKSVLQTDVNNCNKSLSALQSRLDQSADRVYTQAEVDAWIARRDRQIRDRDKWLSDRTTKYDALRSQCDADLDVLDARIATLTLKATQFQTQLTELRDKNAKLTDQLASQKGKVYTKEEVDDWLAKRDKKIADCEKWLKARDVREQELHDSLAETVAERDKCLSNSAVDRREINFWEDRYGALSVDLRNCQAEKSTCQEQKSKCNCDGDPDAPPILSVPLPPTPTPTPTPPGPTPDPPGGGPDDPGGGPDDPGGDPGGDDPDVPVPGLPVGGDDPDIPIPGLPIPIPPGPTPTPPSPPGLGPGREFAGAGPPPSSFIHVPMHTPRRPDLERKRSAFSSGQLRDLSVPSVVLNFRSRYGGMQVQK